MLLVEPHTLLRDAFERAIGNLTDLTVCYSVPSLREAADRWERDPPRLLIVSLLEGSTLLDSIAPLWAGRELPRTVVLDEQVVDAHVQHVLRLGLAGYLTKGQPLSQIESALRRASRGEQVFAPAVAERLVFASTGIRLAGGGHDERLGQLTPRELDVLRYVAQGYSVKRAADVLGISVSTVDNHKSRLMKKLRVHKSVELTHLALSNGWISPQRAR